jgi:pyruvate dehydrogenase E1 component alpha subunit
VEKEEMVNMLKKMIRIRKFEERVVDLFAKGKIPGFVHSYLGEEAVAVGACSVLRDDDFITSTHRGHGHLIAKGGNLNYMMAELYGKKTGYCKGKGGSMHIADLELGMLGANGIVGAGMPIAIGSGLSAKVRGTDQATVCFFGDGASNRGTFHESLNVASIWKLPVVFMNENNLYAISLSQKKSMAVPNVSDRASGYAIPGLTIDGNDVIAVFEATTEAVKRARNGEGPTLIEAQTYRWRGHFEGDPTTYRSPEELEGWKKNKDPINLFEDKLLLRNLITNEEIESIVKKIEGEVEGAVKFAEESPYPNPEETLEDVYVGEGA